MDGQEVIKDYSMIDAFISQNLTEFNRKLFGDRDEQTGYFDEVDIEEPEVENLENNTAPDEDEYDTSDEMSPEDMYDYLYGADDQRSYSPPQEGEESGGPAYTGDIRSSGAYGSQNVGTYGKKIYGEVFNFWGYTPVANSIYRSKKQNDDLIRQGKPASKNSFHLTGNAVDFKPSDWNKLSSQQKAYMKENYDVIYHDNHYHVEPKQAGGAVARTPQQQFIGLNDDSLDNLYLPLEGTNPIRGLDSGEPVYVEDQAGNSQILYGPTDVVHMTGGVYEKRVSKKYKTRK